MILVGNSVFLHSMDVEFPLIQSIVYTPYPNQPTLAKNAFRLFLDLNYANIYTFDSQKVSVNDMETFTGTLGVGYGLSDAVTLELYFRNTVAYHGIMDKFIMDFHDLFRMSQGARYEFPPNIMNYQYKNYFSYDQQAVVPSPLILGILGQIYRAGNFHLNGRLAIGLPLASKPGFSSNQPFLTGGIIFLYKTRNFSAHFSNHVSVFKDPRWMVGEDLRNHIFHSEIRLDYKKIFGGVQYKSTPFKMESLSDAWQMYLGVKFLKRFEFSIFEEFPPMDTTPDVSFNLRIYLLEN